MTHLFHITTPGEWQAGLDAGSFIDPSLDTEGFIHGSYLHQLIRSANLHYVDENGVGRDGLIALEIDASRLDCELRIEDSYGSGQAFPHIYGPLNPDAVVGTHALERRSDTYALSDELRRRRSAMPLVDDLSGPTAWRGDDLAQRSGEWQRSLTDSEIEALIDTAHAASTVDDLASLEAATGGVVGGLADEIRDALLSGLGFRVLSGFPVDQLDQRATAAMLMQLGMTVGRPRSQNARGHLLGHVTDVGADLDDPATRVYQTNRRQTFHTDSTDAVGLLCLKTAVEGGQSMLASATEVFRTLMLRRPDLAARLFEPVATDRRGEQPEGADPWFEIPVLSWFEEALSVQYHREYIESARRFPDAPHPDAEHGEALDLFDAICNERGIALTMDLAPGDLQFVHNHSLVHDRTEFVDSSEPARRRHLLRLWLSLPGDRPLPPVYEQRWGTTTLGDRGGIIVPGTELNVPLEP